MKHQMNKNRIRHSGRIKLGIFKSLTCYSMQICLLSFNQAQATLFEGSAILAGMQKGSSPASRSIFERVYSLMVHNASASDLKKIRIVETNNTPDFIISGVGTFRPFDEDYLGSMLTYIEQQNFKPEGTKELDLILQGLAWVTKQWVHDGMNQPPSNFRGLDILKSVHEKKERYRCVEYGIVLADVLQSLGFITRVVSLRNPDVAYGGFGKGHVAMEVWVNDLNKWIFLDPQFGVHITKKGDKTPLNYYELFLERKSGGWETLEPHFVTLSTPNFPADLTSATVKYKTFLTKYFGFVSVSGGPDYAKISLLLDSKDMPLTFQGTQADNLLYTHKSDLLYPAMNQTSILLAYEGDGSLLMTILRKLNIQTEEDYLKNMSKFAAIPKFIAKFQTNTPLHKFFEYRFGPHEDWQKTELNKINWDATKSENYLEVRSVNEFDRRGPSTFMKVAYN